jgi:hypothetical protein
MAKRSRLHVRNNVAAYFHQVKEVAASAVQATAADGVDGLTEKMLSKVVLLFKAYARCSFTTTSARNTEWMG